MTAGSFQDAKEQVRQAVDIVDLVGGYLDLRREGRLFKALCPWHDDSRPSLTVNQERQTYRCWVCDLGGDIFNFVMRMEGIEFPAALRMLADRAGIVLQQTPAAAQARDEKSRLYAAMAWSVRQYHQCLLHDPAAAPAREYLRLRGFTTDTIHRFHLGFAPNQWDWIQARATSEGGTLSRLASVGVLGQGENRSDYYDRFRGRLLFPIRDTQGRDVGLGGRVLPEFADERSAKYVNSPETPLFAKSRLLYAFDAARDAISRSRTAVVVEGYTDCLMAHQLGMKNVVAVLGTAIGEGHIKALRPFADKIVLVLDGDEAGRRRAAEVLQLFVSAQMDVRVLTLPEESDPCDFLLAKGVEAFQQAIDTAGDALDYKLNLVKNKLTKNIGPHEVQSAVEEVLSVMAHAPRLSKATTTEHRMKEDSLLATLAARSGIGEQSLRHRMSELRKAKKSPTSREQKQPTVSSSEMTKWERQLFEDVLLAPQCLPKVRATIQLENFTCSESRELFDVLCALEEQGVAPGVESLLLRIDDLQLQSRILALAEDGQSRTAGRSTDEITAELNELLKNLSDNFTREGESRRLHELRTGQLSEAELDLNELIAQKRRQQGISSPTDG
ncbi:MAG: DNA primase [Pirellulales bacterium]|nr:DNA primase [Pirellulales bacterium]